MRSSIFCWSARALVISAVATVVCPLLGWSAAIGQEVVKLNAALNSKKNHTYVDVQMQIEAGWHAYAAAPGVPAEPVVISFQLPEGVELAGDLQTPLALPSAKSPKVRIYEGDVTFRQELKLEPSDVQREIKVVVRYQVCDPRICQPPASETLAVKIPADQTVTREAKVKFEHPLFTAPAMLMVGDKPLNVAADQMYPSPAIYDVDNDGKDELIVGDIFGSLNIYENAAEWGHGDPVWEAHRALESADGEPIRVSNW